MGNRWYVSLGDQEVGPLSDTGLERMIQGGRIEGDALVRNGVGGEWTAAREVEPILAARPGRRRPGEEAIEAARRAKYQQQLPQQQQPASSRPPAPMSQIVLPPPGELPASQPTNLQPSAAKGAAHQTVTVTEDILSAPDDLPLVQPPDAARSTAGAPILAPYVVAPGDAAETALPPKRRSPYLFIAIGAGLLALVAVICSAAWFLLGGGLSSNSSPPQSQSASIDPQLAALRQQAEQLRRELAEAKQKLESPPQPSAARPPAEMSEIPETSTAKHESSAATEPPLAEDSGAKAAANEPDAEAMANPPAVDLEAGRGVLAVMLAKERVIEDVRKEFRQCAAKFESTLEFGFEPQYESEFARRFVEAEAEVAAFDGKRLAAEQQAVEARREARRKEAARLLAEARAAVEPLELRSAVLKACESEILMALDDSGASNAEFANELNKAMPNSVFLVLNEMPDARLKSLIGAEQLPSDWPDRATDPLIAEAVRKVFVRMAPVAYGMRRASALLQQTKEAQASIDLVTLRTIFLFSAVNKALADGEITTAEILPLIDVYGVCRVDDSSPLIEGVISRQDLNQLDGDNRVEFLFDLVQGKIELETYRDVYAKARQAAGDAWPPDDRPHPLAGRWKGKENWEIEIDPRRERIVFRRASPEATFEQRICKMGRDHLIAYEKRTVPIERVAADPFRTENYDSDDGFPSPDGAIRDEAIAFTYYSQSKGGALLQIRRRIHSADWVQESVGREFWQLISKPKRYREFRAAYRRVKE